MINSCTTKEYDIRIFGAKFESFNSSSIVRDYAHMKQMRYQLSNNDSCSRSLTSCILFIQHRRDDCNYKEIYHTIDIKQIVLQKMLDQIHLHLSHPLSVHIDIESENSKI